MPRHGDEPVPGYRLQNRLGKGSFGEVWRASGPGGTLAALKFIALGDSQAQREFRAVQRIKQIRHVHLMPIIGIWLVDQNEELLDEEFLADWESTVRAGVNDSAHTRKLQAGGVRRPVELIEAMPLGDQDLFGRLQECRAAGGQGIPIDELLGHLEDAAKAIDFLNSPRHDLGDGPVAIHHGDIKPQNIMLVGGAAQVCDFGLARLLGSSQATSTALAGSPAYMAPETIRDKRPHRATDQYSLAITYAELRTGALPFHTTSYLEVLNSHLDGTLNFAALPEAEHRVIVRATAIDPDDRYPSCVQMVTALRAAVPDEMERGADALPLHYSGNHATLRPGVERQHGAPGSGTSRPTHIADTIDTGARLLRPADDEPRSSRSGSSGRGRLWASVVFVGAFAGLLVAATIFMQNRPGSIGSLAKNNAPSPPPTVAESAADTQPSSLPEERKATEVADQVVDRLAPPTAHSIDKGPATAATSEPPFLPAEGAEEHPAAAPHLDPLPADLTNSIEMRLRLVPAGEFLMGSPESTEALQEAFAISAKDRQQPWAQFQDEGPQHLVKISQPFYIGQQEVTVAEFGKFVAATEYKSDAERDSQGGGGWDQASGQLKSGPEYTWRSWGFSQTDDSPVVNVSWNDAVKFCEWLSAKEGRTYRLPTEAEWELACRAGTIARFNSGVDRYPEGLEGIANVPDHSAREKLKGMKYVVSFSDGAPFTAPVGSYRPNALGIHDMLGNVWEWCADWYGDRYYAESPVFDPKGPAEGTDRVLRGGGWTPYPIFCRSSYRGWNPPEYRENFIGFRVVLDVQP